jgi:DNA-binding NtrC family response regulator
MPLPEPGNVARLSETASGTEVAFHQPAIIIEGHAMQIGVETSRAVENKRVFVVDDDDITRTVLQFMLQDDNETHDLATLTDAYAKSRQGRPDLLLLGLSIVETNGPALLPEIATRWPGTRILLITAPGQDAAAQPYLKAGAHGVVGKPFTVEAVRRKVDAQLGRIMPSLIQLQLG